MLHVVLNEWLYPFIAHIINIHGSGVLIAHCGCCMAGATWNAAVWAQVLCTPFNHAPGYSVTSFKTTWVIDRVYACLAVTCHLHFGKNDQDLLCATAVTRGWNGYRNKSPTPAFSCIKSHSCRDSNLQPFNHESGALTTELSCWAPCRFNASAVISDEQSLRHTAGFLELVPTPQQHQGLYHYFKWHVSSAVIQKQNFSFSKLQVQVHRLRCHLF